MRRSKRLRVLNGRGWHAHDLTFCKETDFTSLEDHLSMYSITSNNSSLSLMVTMTLFGNMASRVQGDVYFTGVHEIIALTSLPRMALS